MTFGKRNIAGAGSSYIQLSLLASFFVFFSMLLSPAHATDPCFPTTNTSDKASTSYSKFSWVRKSQLRAELQLLKAELLELPQYHPIILSNRLGYHSTFFSSQNTEDTPYDTVIHYKLHGRTYPIGAIAFAPAVNPREMELKSYGFPKRFKIECLTKDSNDWKTIVDWTEEDFEDPGIYPVLFSNFDLWASEIKMTFPQSLNQERHSFLALGEIYIFQPQPESFFGANIVKWPSVQIESNDSLSIPTLWNKEFINDGLWCGGAPLSDEVFEKPDFLIIPEEASQLDEEITFLIDLSKSTRISRIDIWPAQASGLNSLPSFGFPSGVKVKIGNDLQSLDETNFGGLYDENVRLQGLPLTIFAGNTSARYVQVSFSNFSQYRGENILGVGEIMVTSRGQVVSLNQTITATGIPDTHSEQLNRLTDGYSHQRRILTQGEWIKGLAERRPLDQRIQQLRKDISDTNIRWEKTKSDLTVLIITFLILLLVAGFIYQRRQKQNSLKALKQRIMRDLHDEVGSNLGGISLTAGNVERLNKDENLQPSLLDLKLMAREANASLREVVWVIDQKNILLHDLISQLFKRAERILHGTELETDQSQKIPNITVSLESKRHLLMLYKEVVHNCARHSQASRVKVSIGMPSRDLLTIQVQDNGKGFNPTETCNGWGIENMRKRANEMNWNLQITSIISKGTTVGLQMSLITLSDSKSNTNKSSYVTSN